jgi:branched-chain amino acid transport system ATP-binding protein
MLSSTWAHHQAILGISHQAVVLDQGRVVHSGPAAQLQAHPELINTLLGVSKEKV